MLPFRFTYSLETLLDYDIRGYYSSAGFPTYNAHFIPTSYAVNERVGVSHSEHGQSLFINNMPDNSSWLHLLWRPICGSVPRQFFDSPVMVGFPPQHFGVYVPKSSSYILSSLMTIQ